MSARSNTSRVFYRSFQHPMAVAAKAEGVYFTDTAGKQYLDASGGAAVSCLGHGNRTVIEAVKAQLDEMAFAHTAFFSSTPSEKLAEILSDKAPGGEWRTYFLSGGSEANETALKLARQIQVERGQVDRSVFVSRKQAYHGGTITTMSVGGRMSNGNLYGPILNLNVEKISPCFPFRGKKEGEGDDAYLARITAELEEVINRLGENKVIAFIAETVAGATIGAVPPVPGYFAEMRRICDAHGVIMILDEVMCGMGRCGKLFAFEDEDVVPDMITLAKGLGGGYQPLGAVMVREKLAREIEAGSGAFMHGHTYVGHATACAAGVAVQEVFEAEGLIDQVAQNSGILAAKLEEAFGDHPHVGDIRGRGFFRAIELVRDTNSNEPFEPSIGLAVKLKQQCLENGLVCYPLAGTVDGASGEHVLLAPPFIFTHAHMDEMIDKLKRAIDQVINDA